MRGSALAVFVVVATAACVCALSLVPSGAFASSAAVGCRVLDAPRSLGTTLLSLHRAYERHQPDVHNPRITGPVGRVDLGTCGGERYALAWFDAKYNGFSFGTEDQPERFIQPPDEGWRDIGNTVVTRAGSAPTRLLEAWRIVRSCT